LHRFADTIKQALDAGRGVACRLRKLFRSNGIHIIDADQALVQGSLIGVAPVGVADVF
jgi:hypothetical protein